MFQKEWQDIAGGSLCFVVAGLMTWWSWPILSGSPSDQTVTATDVRVPDGFDCSAAYEVYLVQLDRASRLSAICAELTEHQADEARCFQVRRWNTVDRAAPCKDIAADRAQAQQWSDTYGPGIMKACEESTACTAARTLYLSDTGKDTGGRSDTR
jgi:hypothetical protein